MTYKIEIFKSESYQKILKAVLKFRYPDLSYEEGLYQESCINGCLGYNLKVKKFFTLYARAYSGYQSEIGFMKYEQNEPREKAKPFSEEVQLFGRPITICELVDVLNAKDNNFVYRDGRLESQSSCQYGNFLATELEFTFKTYYLHEQTQETIDEIAKLLD